MIYRLQRACQRTSIALIKGSGIALLVGLLLVLSVSPLSVEEISSAPLYADTAPPMAFLPVLTYRPYPSYQPAAGLPAPPDRRTANAPALRETIIIGSSVQGQSIEAFRIGSGSRSIVLAGAIHGDEVNSHLLANDLLAYFDGNMHLLPPDVTLYVIPAINPDGLRSNSRYNANGVDLNRNWATGDWQTDTYDADGKRQGSGGPFPFSEPETAALSAWLLQLRDQSSDLMVVFYHSAYPPSGLVLGGSVGRPVTPAYAEIVGYAGSGSTRPGWSAYQVTGAAPGWCGDNTIGCFEVELPSRANLDAARVQRHATAVLSVLMWQQVESGQRCFAETGFCISGRIGEFWQQQGGLAIFGLPISRQQELLVDGVPRQVQWFERNRLELHPENTQPYDVLLGRIGVERLEQQGRNWWTFEPGSTASSSGQPCQFFADTQHSICGDILNAWRSSGLELDRRPGTSEAESLSLFGMPLSEAQTETLGDGQAYVVQWFERARFEIHTQYAPPAHVLLGLLGTEMQQEGPTGQ